MSIPTSETTPLLQDTQIRVVAINRGWHSRYPKTHHMYSGGALSRSAAPSGRWSNFGYVHALILSIPMSFLAHHLHWDAVLRSCFSLISLVLLTKLIGRMSNEMMAWLIPSLSGVLSRFRFAPDLFTSFFVLCLAKPCIAQPLVKTLMLGLLLSKMLLVLGISFGAAGFKFRESSFQAVGAQVSGSVMLLVCMILITSSEYNTLSATSLLVISRASAILLLGVYASYMYFQLRTHPYLFESENPTSTNVGRCDGINFFTPVRCDIFWFLVHNYLISLVFGLLTGIAMASICAEHLKTSIGDFAEYNMISKSFIELIILPTIVNTYNLVSSVHMAMVNEMEISIIICVGGSIQIATLGLPFLVIHGWIFRHPSTLFFSNFEVMILFSTVLLVNMVIGNGRSNYLEGILLSILYFLIALCCYNL